jgi:hypothetical protein
MNYFAKLVVGGKYILRGRIFERGVELAVSKDDAEYLKSKTDNRLIPQGDNFALLRVPVFAVREEEPTVQERVLEEIKDAPDTLKPKRRTNQEAE